MRRFFRYVWRHKKLSVIIIITIGFLLFFLSPKNGSEIETQKVKRTDIVQSITSSGEIKSQTSVKLNFLSAGKLVYVGAKKGDFVKKWQTLAALDSRTVQKNLEDDLKDYLKQRNTFDDTNENNQNRTVPQALNDDMKRVLQNNQYDLEKAVISVELQSLAKEQSFLISPIDGVVTQTDVVVPGVNVAITNSFTVADPNNVIFMIDVDEADIGNLRLDMRVKVTLESFPNDPIDLTVSKIDFTSHTSSNGGNVFTVEATLPNNTDYKYRIGMTGDAEIILSEKKDRLIVPIGSIADEQYVYVKKGEIYEKRKVKLGIQSDTDQEILSGLREGEEVATLPDEAAKLQSNTKRFFFF